MKLKTLLTLFLVLALWVAAVAQEPEQEEPTQQAPTQETSEPEKENSEEPKWEVQVTPTGWVMNMDLTLTGPNRSVNGTVKAKNVVNDIQFAIGGAFAARKGDWGFMVDGNFIRLKETRDFALANQPTRTLFSVTPDVRNSIFQGAGTYRVLDEEAYSLDALAGFRYYDMDIFLSAAPVTINNALLPRTVTLERNLSFVDPILGAKGKMALGKKVDAFLYGDIGGFGVGSDFTYRLDAGLDWKFAKNWSALLGYRVLGVDYTTGSGPNRFQYESTAYGPTLGISWRK